MPNAPHRKLIVTEFVSLDGVMEAPEKWSFPYGNEEFGKFKLDELHATDALLLGRVTYDGFAAAWPGRADEAGFADKFNSMPKHVVSDTLKSADWTNSHVIRGANAVAEIRKLKQQPGKGDVVVHGSRDLVTF